MKTILTDKRAYYKLIKCWRNHVKSSEIFYHVLRKFHALTLHANGVYEGDDIMTVYLYICHKRAKYVRSRLSKIRSSSWMM
jgi:hypothetical protein